MLIRNWQLKGATVKLNIVVIQDTSSECFQFELDISLNTS